MAKQLIIFRHANAQSSGGAGGDHARALSAQGEQVAASMGKVLTLAKQIPDFALCSSAKRAMSTIQIAAQDGVWTCPIDYSDAIYETSSASMLKVIQDFSNSDSKTMIVGHEPTWSTLCSDLVGGGNFRFCTAAMACIEFSTNHWCHVENATGSLKWFIQPEFTYPLVNS